MDEFIIDERMQDLIDTSVSQKEKEQTYKVLINRFIRQKYQEQDVEAIINNYLDDMNNVKHLNEFRELQAYRNRCKIKAKELLNL